jgi:FkbH-like protein
MYKAEEARKELQAQSRDLTSFYASLEMILEIRNVDEFTISRVAQLTQKTNQFSLTTRRYSDAEIHTLSESASADVIHVRLQDRFGESGLTGVCILRYERDRALIDSFLLSCRVWEGESKTRFLVQCMKRARARGCTVAVGEYRPTAKNEQVKDFYPNHAFRRVAGDPEAHYFELDLTSFDGREPPYFHRIDTQFPDRAKVGSQ